MKKISAHERERRARQSAQAQAREAYDLRDFCQCYSIGRSLAYEEIKKGRLRVKKAGRRTLVPRANAEDWFANLPTA